jgi:hypothetical protein
MHIGSRYRAKVPVEAYAATMPFFTGKIERCLAFARVLADRLHGFTMIPSRSVKWFDDAARCGDARTRDPRRFIGRTSS